MADKIVKVLNKRSNVIVGSGQPKLPTASDLDYGEIAINYAKGVETISLKNSANEIVAFQKATTLAGYGITDAKIEGNVITLGENSITPITEHQSLEDYAKKTKATSDADGLMSKEDYEYLQYLNGIATGVDIGSVSATKHIVIANVTSGKSFGISSMPINREVHIIVRNIGSSDVIIPIPSTYASNTDQITVEAAKYGEINVIYDGFTYYVRAV